MVIRCRCGCSTSLTFSAIWDVAALSQLARWIASWRCYVAALLKQWPMIRRKGHIVYLGDLTLLVFGVSDFNLL